MPFEAGYYLTAFLTPPVFNSFHGCPGGTARASRIFFDLLFNTSLAWIPLSCLDFYLFLVSVPVVAVTRTFFFTYFFRIFYSGRLWLYNGCLDGCLVMSSIPCTGGGMGEWGRECFKQQGFRVANINCLSWDT